MSIASAKALRANPTAAEKRLWRLLYPFRTSRIHFRKQAQIGPFYVDFVCHHAGLVIEVDGDLHGTYSGQITDRRRDDYLASRDYVVLRFSNGDVLRNPEGVFQTISDWLKTPLPTSPAEGEVPVRVLGTILPGTPDHTLPLAGRVAEGAGR